MRQVTSKDGKGGRALAVQDVAASPDTVWNRILAFPEYPKMVTGVQAQPMPHASRLTPHAARRTLTPNVSRLKFLSAHRPRLITHGGTFGRSAAIMRRSHTGMARKPSGRA